MAAADGEIAALTRRQHGVVAAHQLRAVGVSNTQIRRRVADGRLRRVHRGTYAVGPIGQKGAWLAAVLACGAGARLSHRDAAALHGLRRTSRARIDVTVPVRRQVRHGIDVHVSRGLHDDDCSVVDGIPATSIARTLLDLTEVVSPTQLQRAYEEAERLRILDVRAVAELLARSNGRRGVGRLRTLLDYDPAAAVDARSELESRFVDLIREAGIPLPRLNVMVEGFEVDAYWPEARLVVELQGYRNHSHPRAFERDHVKLARLKLAGLEVLPLTWRQVVDRRPQVAELIRILGGRGSQRVC